MTDETNNDDRAKVLLKAALDMLKKLNDSPYVMSPFETTVVYDGADCDGSCLMEDIEHFLKYGDS